VEVTEIDASRIEPGYPELPSGGCIEVGRGDTAAFFWSGWYGPEGSFRWSRGTRAELVFALAPGPSRRLVLDASCFGEQRVSVTLNGRAVAGYRCPDWSVHRRSFDLPPGAPRATNRLVFSLPDARSPASLGKGGDRRILALALYRLCLEPVDDGGSRVRSRPGKTP